MIQRRNCILITTTNHSKGWVIIIEALFFVIVLTGFAQCRFSANWNDHFLFLLEPSTLASSVNVGLLFATAFVNHPRPRRRRGENQQVNHPCSSSHIHDWFVYQASTLIMGATSTSLFMMQQPPSKPLNDDQRQKRALGNKDNTRINDTDPVIKRKGLTYASDGITIIDSLFQNIADGIVSPGMSHSTHHNSNQNITSENRLAGDTNSTVLIKEEEKQQQLQQRRQLLYQDEYVAAFYPLDEGCPQGHILVVPRNRPLSNDKDEETNDGDSEQQPLFLKTFKDLQPIKQDIELLKHMKQVGYNVVLDHQKLTMKNASNSGSISIPATSSFGYVFHVPPFNSIDHLHLHVFGSKNERVSWKHYIKYPPFNMEPPWCIQFDTILTSLERRYNNGNSDR